MFGVNSDVWMISLISEGLMSQLTMTKIMSNPEDDGSFSMKSIKMKFYGHSGMGSCLRDL